MYAIRLDRMNEEVRKVLSDVIREMRDPRILPVTSLTDVQLTPDLKYARVKVSVFDEDQAACSACVRALNHAAGFISRELGSRVRIRNVPQLSFVLDDSIAYSAHINRILDSLNEREEQNRDA